MYSFSHNLQVKRNATDGSTSGTGISFIIDYKEIPGQTRNYKFARNNKMNEWYRQETNQVLKQLNVNAASGLSETEATDRLKNYGPNELVERGRKKLWLIFVEQFTNHVLA